MTEPNDTIIIQHELPADYFFTDVSLESCEEGIVHAPDDSHMTDIDGRVSAAPSEIDVIARNGLVRFFVVSEK